MADKQVTRPIGLDPSWANDELINDPGEAWDGDTTKVEPGAGKRDDGYLPEENPDAQELNHVQNETGRWLQYFSNMQAMNWTPGGRVGEVTTAGQINSAGGLCYDEGSGQWIAVGRIISIAGEVSISQDGHTWTAIAGAPLASVNLDYVASKHPDFAPTHLSVNALISSATNASVIELLGGGLSGFTAPGVGTVNVAMQAWDEGNSQWIVVGGEDQAGTPLPAVWTDGTPMTGLTQRASAAVNSTRAELLAIDRAGLSVVIGDGAAPNFDVWTSLDAITFTQTAPVGVGVGESARSMIFDEARGVFVLLTERATYTSIDGVNWSLVGSFSGGGVHAVRCFASDNGGMYVAGVDGLGAAIRYSSDGGVNWRIVLVPGDYDQTGGAGASTDTVSRVCYSQALRRFAYSVSPPTGTYYGFVGLSLAVGDTTVEANGTTRSIPQVT